MKLLQRDDVARSASPKVATILLVDDDFVCRSKLRVQFAQMGYRVVEAKDGESAWNILTSAKARTITLVATDIRMPLMDGLGLLQKIREHIPEMPVMMLTAYDDAEVVKKALRLGAKDYIEKPIKEISAFSDRIAAVIEEASWDVRRRLKVVKDDTDTCFAQLTDREKEVLKLTVEGYTSEESSQLLYISRRTVEGHRAKVLKKLGLRSSYDLYRFVAGRSLVSRVKTD